MDMCKKIGLVPLTADTVEYGLKMAEADGEISAVEAASSRRMIAVMRAAEKMADAIDAFGFGGSQAQMGEASRAFRKAMRGEQ